ncbi:hypothetical protein NKH77_18925 [Streptomyces sp. M19]
MPQIAITNTFWEGVDRLDKPSRARVHKAMGKFQQLTVHQLHADKGLHLESVVGSRDPRMRTIRVDDGQRIVLLAPDDGSDVFVFVHVVSHDKAYSWAKRRLYSVNAVTRCLEVRDLTAMEQITRFSPRRPRPRRSSCSPGGRTPCCATSASTTSRCAPPASSPARRSWRRSGR